MGHGFFNYTPEGNQADNLKLLVDCGGFNFTSTFFPYTSGKVGPYFINSEAVTKRSDANDFAIESMGRLAESKGLEFDAISGGETRDWVFSYALRGRFGVPHLTLYKNGKKFGPDVNGKRVLHVADLNNEGSSLRDYWVPMIREAGGTVEDILFYVDRCEAGVQVVEDLGLRSHSVVSLDEMAWEQLRGMEESGVTPEVYANLTARQNDPEAWARSMLRSEAGFGALVNYFRDPKSAEKARKILTVGYPDMRNELDTRLRQEGIAI